MTPGLAAYHRLGELLERELELAGQGRFDLLAPLEQERDQLIAELPLDPPAAARGALERALALRHRLTVELLRGREELLAELGRLEHGRRVAQGYRGPSIRAPRVCASA